MENRDEQAFLKSHAARTQAAQQRRTASRNKSQQVTAFWKDIRDDLREWDGRLQSVVATNDTALSLTTESVRSVSMQQLDTMQDSLRELRRKALSPSVEDVLPVADVRILYQEFANRVQRLDEYRKEWCPPSKFVFRRYRAALQQQSSLGSGKDGIQQNKRQTTSSGVNETTTLPKPTQQLALVQHGKTLSGCSGSFIEENPMDGSFQMSSKDDKGVQTKRLWLNGRGNESDNDSRNQKDHQDSSSLTVRDLSGCTVSIKASYKALHLIETRDCIVHIHQPVGTAIHITGCHDTVVRVPSCQQLRIHESSKLDLHVRTKSGPILEDSTAIRFVVSSNDPITRDVKDFSWLRNGVPSPNFKILIVDNASRDQKENTNMSGHVQGTTDNRNQDTTGHSDNRKGHDGQQAIEESQGTVQTGVVQASLQINADDDEDDDDDDDDDEDEL